MTLNNKIEPLKNRIRSSFTALICLLNERKEKLEKLKN
jgi:hypothetical protein